MSITDPIVFKRGLIVINPLLLVIGYLVFLANVVILYNYSIESTVTLVSEYVFVVIHSKMGIKQNSLTSLVILCRYGNTKDVFPIGGLVDIGETPIATGSRYRLQLIDFFVKATRTIVCV